MVEGEAERTKTGLWVYLSRQRPSLELTLGLLVRAGGLSAVNAIGTKLRETIYSASAKLRVDVNGRRRGKREESKDASGWA